MPTTDRSATTSPSSRRVLGTGVLAGVLSVAVNLAIRALALALSDRPDVPYPLVLPPVVEFTFLPTLLGTLLFLLLRRTTTQPLRWLTISAAAVVVLSWTAPLTLYLHPFPHHEITAGVLLALLVMHTTPAVLLITALRRITPPRKPPHSPPEPGTRSRDPAVQAEPYADTGPHDQHG